MCLFVCVCLCVRERKSGVRGDVVSVYCLAQAINEENENI